MFGTLLIHIFCDLLPFILYGVVKSVENNDLTYGPNGKMAVARNIF